MLLSEAQKEAKHVSPLGHAARVRHGLQGTYQKRTGPGCAARVRHRQGGERAKKRKNDKTENEKKEALIFLLLSLVQVFLILLN